MRSSLDQNIEPLLSCHTKMHDKLHAVPFYVLEESHINISRKFNLQRTSQGFKHFSVYGSVLKMKLSATL